MVQRQSPWRKLSAWAAAEREASRSLTKMGQGVVSLADTDEELIDGCMSRLALLIPETD